MKRLTRLVRDENLDLYLLGLVALAFTLLGVVGLAETSVLISATLALLAMMVDPDDEPVIAAAALIGYSGSDPALLAGRIRGVLAELDHLRSLTGGNLEIRLTRHVPTVGLQVIDGGYVCAQRFEYRPPAESGPILALEPRDGLWFHRFAAEAERMWDDGVPWPG
ncbi:hypothetical protein [Herbidospora yilanensis]|uniref:hypothetical protein n=1 Tax=Herbidospora yilanensis TaxID=354426 RepID=UPI000781EEF4|nr:hypothetical protein [Herbidospora yilanensis]